jgi:hypothetical protein
LHVNSQRAASSTNVASPTPQVYCQHVELNASILLRDRPPIRHTTWSSSCRLCLFSRTIVDVSGRCR